MPKTKGMTAKETAAVSYYCEPTSETRNNGVQSCLAAGYSNCIGSEHNALRVLAKDYIKTAITTTRDKIGKSITVSREFCLDKLLHIVDTTNDDRTAIAAITVIGDFAGYKRELAPNQEREQARQDLLSTEVKEIMVLVRRRTTTLSQPKLESMESNMLDSSNSSKLEKSDSSK